MFPYFVAFSLDFFFLHAKEHFYFQDFHWGLHFELGTAHFEQQDLIEESGHLSGGGEPGSSLLVNLSPLEQGTIALVGPGLNMTFWESSEPFCSQNATTLHSRTTEEEGFPFEGGNSSGTWTYVVF